MKMSRYAKFGVSSAVIAATGALLIATQPAEQGSGRADIGRGGSGRVEDVTWLLKQERIPGVPLRDIFSPGSREEKSGRKEKAKVTFVSRKDSAAAAAKPKPPTRAWQPPRLVGIAIRRGIGRAVFVDGEKVLIASAGDRIKGYRISRIRERQVDVKDLRNGLKRTIYLK